ncbi:hypothetical protein K7432_004024, partial [Basidiobolus ranarum]
MIRPLEKEAIRKISSGQVIVTIDSVIKELCEVGPNIAIDRNALDANASSITVRLIDGGLTSISVKDNGMGIPLSDRLNMTKRYYTSKIQKLEDLDSITSYGFRGLFLFSTIKNTLIFQPNISTGEALNSICTACPLVQITTKTIKDSTSIVYDIDNTGTITSSKSVGGETGTTINVFKIFQHFPVAQKTVNNTIKRIMDCLISFALIHPKIRLSFTNKEMKKSKIRGANTKEWIKIGTKNILDSIRAVFGKELTSQLQYRTYQNSDINDSSSNIFLEVVLPRRNSDPAVVCKGERSFFYINKRPVSVNRGEIKQILGKIRAKYNNDIAHGQEDASTGSKKTPFILFHIRLPLGSFDVNIEPSKNVLLLHSPQTIFQIIDKFLEELYPETHPTMTPESNKPATIQSLPSVQPDSVKPSNTEELPKQDLHNNESENKQSKTCDKKTLINEHSTTSSVNSSSTVEFNKSAYPNNETFSMANHKTNYKSEIINSNSCTTVNDKSGTLPNNSFTGTSRSKGCMDDFKDPVLVSNSKQNQYTNGKELARVPQIHENHTTTKSKAPCLEKPDG